ncbi:hypothetical protein WMY93_029637 [Mugilogobius chulae]|uniref:FAT domain-containing protein n=1 Tax=Mugilogobius chulae TaxID=88201 RepID=A0AAW0MSC0_9GOBI
MTVNTELLKSLTSTVPRLTKAPLKTPLCFRERSVRKTQGKQLVEEVLKRWDNLSSWWDGDSATPESKTAILVLLSKLLQASYYYTSVICKVLQTTRASTVAADFRVQEIFNKFYSELCQKHKLPDSVLGKINELLGVLAEVHPNEMVNNSDKLYKAYLGELKEQMTSSTREPKLLVVAGCLRGLTALMVNFTKTMDEDPTTSKEIFQYALKAISPQMEMTRYAVTFACKKVCPQDVDLMYTELIQRCKQMYLTESDGEDDSFYQLPSFLDSIASVLIHLDKIPEVYTPLLERLLVVQIDSFPQYSERMQITCCRAVLKVLVAMASKGPVLWSFISSVFTQGLIRVCSKPLLIEDKDAETPQKLKCGLEIGSSLKSKYLALYKSLLDCDQLKDTGYLDGAFESQNAALRSLSRLIYDEIVKSILRIVEKLDLSVQKVTPGEEGSEDVTHALPSSDPTAHLLPNKVKDFTAFINLVDFCSELLLSKHLEYFDSWMYPLSHELILHSIRNPLVCVKMKQYKDELLASCLTFVLSLHHNIIALDIKAYSPALEAALKLGLSHVPLANTALDALEDWSNYIPLETMQPCYTTILPLLDGYLKTTSNDNKDDSNWEVISSVSARSDKGYSRVMTRLLKKSKQLAVEEAPLVTVRLRVVKLLGHLGGKLNRNLVTVVSSEEMMKKFVAWDSEKRLNFAVPFSDMKPVIYLDPFLPRISELALSTSDRQTKVAACELLHTLVIYMVGKSAQMAEGENTLPPMYKLHKRLFPVLLRLACDVDQVTRQLFEPLVMQLIHWFTNNKKFESQDTVAVLESILDGVVDPMDSTLRDFCGRCIEEFVKWSIKQTTPNSTIQQCCSAIDHLKRVIKQKAPTLNQHNPKRRIPRGFPPDQKLCLSHLILWLLEQCGRPQTECRHKCMELFYEFVPLLPEKKSAPQWLDGMLKQNGAEFLVSHFEGGGLLSQPTLRDLSSPFSVRTTLQWNDLLLAALDCYNTFINLHIIRPHHMLACKDKSIFLKAVGFFLSELATRDLAAAESCFTISEKTSHFSPREVEQYNYSKCTIIVRLLEFAAMILVKGDQEFWKALEQDLLSPVFFELMALVVCEPSSVGFNMADVEVMNNLPEVCVPLLKALMSSPYQTRVESSLRAKISRKSVEDLCAVDFYDSESLKHQDQMETLLSSCKQIHKAGFLNSVLHSQDAVYAKSIGSKLLMTVYKGIAPGEDRSALPSLNVNTKRLADGLLQLGFSLSQQSEQLVDLLLNTIMLSVPISGSHIFLQLFQMTINTELLKTLTSTVPRLTKAAPQNPTMVSLLLNGMLDHSFRERSVRKTQGKQLVEEVLKRWDNLSSWWEGHSATPESKTAILVLLSKLLQIDSSVCSSNTHIAFKPVFTTFTTLLMDMSLPLNLKSQALLVLPFFTTLPDESLAELQKALDALVASHFPMQSDEFAKGSLHRNNYMDCVRKLLDALELSHSPLLLKLMASILCRDKKHIMEEQFQTCFQRIARRATTERQLQLLCVMYEVVQRGDVPTNSIIQALTERVLLPLATHCSAKALNDFFVANVSDMINLLLVRFTKSSETAFELQLFKKIGCYKLMELLYSRLPKDDVYSKDSRINQAYCRLEKTEGNEMSKALIKSCFESFTENMAGETQLLELRRHFHCSAYNCAIAVISCSFSEAKFYQGFLFSEKPEKNQFILENIIDVSRTYHFPIEVEVPLERKKKYIMIRKEAHEENASYMADSSLSEEMSQFDFSTGVQSFSYSSQNPEGRRRTTVKKETDETTSSQHAMVDLEMDELNQHECMAAMTALIAHMQRNNITPKVQQGSVPSELPPWMKFLHGKLANPATPLNIRLFVSKLIINSEEVFRPYAKLWLGPLLQLVVSDRNGGDGIHFMVVDIVVTVLSWTTIASPKGNTRDEVLANRLLEFLMKHSFHSKRAVFRHNLEIIRTLVECWKDCLHVPYSLIYDRFCGTDLNSKDNSIGLQLLGIVLANNLPAYDATCGIDYDKYIQSLTNNVTYTRYKEVYSAAAEIIGLILKNMTDRDNQHQQLVDLAASKITALGKKEMHDKFIICVNKVSKHFPPFMDKFVILAFYLLPKLHGVLKTNCLECVLSRADVIPEIFMRLKTSGFIQMMAHRDEARQRVCLDIIHKILSVLKPVELQELLGAVTAFVSHPSPVCRERMYDILMWIQDNYSDSESMEDTTSVEVLNAAKETLLQGLAEENQGLQLYVRNFWSQEKRLPTATFERMTKVLRSLYATQIERSFLSLATNLLLEMTSQSPDFQRNMFEYPLSECTFQFTQNEQRRNILRLRRRFLKDQKKLYRSLEDFDVVRGIFGSKVGTKSITCSALQAEAHTDYAEAVKLYNEALNTEDWSDGPPTDAEKDFWEIAAMEAYSHLTEWASLQYCSTVYIDEASPPDLEKMWAEPYNQEMYLQHMIRSMLKQLQLGGADQTLLSFIDRAMKVEERKKQLENHYSQELSLLYILQEDYDRAKYYINYAMQLFMQNYSSVDTLLTKSRLTILQSVQALTEIQDFLVFVKGDVSASSLKRLTRLWTERYPDPKVDPVNVWDDIITSRCFFLDKILEKLKSQGSADDMEVDGEPDMSSLVNNCKFRMKLHMADSAWGQNNFPVATKLLKDLHRDAKSNRSWFLRWVHSYSRFGHKRSHTLSPVEQISTMLKTIPLLDDVQSEVKSASAKIFRYQKILQGTSFHVMATALGTSPSVLGTIDADKAKKLVKLSGKTWPAEDSKKVESYKQDCVEPGSLIETYMALANFCDKRLREEEQRETESQFPDLLTLPVHIIESMLKALKLNSEEARLKFPRLLQIIELYPSETLDIMTKEMMSVPCWMLIGWISQMVALLDKPEAVAVQHCIEQIAKSYPQALVYSLMISSESYRFEDTAAGHQQQEFVNRLKSSLDKGGSVKSFVEACSS